MSIFYTNKTIMMNRGDSGVVLLSILNRDDTPFALPIGMKNPMVVFSVKSETDTNDLNGNMLIEEYMPIKDYTYYGYGTPDESGQMKIRGGFYPKSKTVNTEESVIDTGIIYKVLANKKYMFVVPTTTPPVYPVSLTKREYAFAVPLVFEPAFTDRLSPGTYTYSITLLDSTSPITRVIGDGEQATEVVDFDGYLKNVILKQDLFGSQKLILGDSPIARVHGDPIRRMYYIKPCSEESVANASASEITTGNITNIALPPVYIATKDQLGGVIVGETLRVDLRGVLDVSKAITDKIADLYAKIGDMTTLTTDEKTTIVGAINEVDAHADSNKAEIGDRSELTTDEKTTLVGAINEVDSHADNATTLANNAVATANGAVATANEAKTTAETAETNANSAVDKADSAIDRANKAYEKAANNVYAVGFMTLQEAITAVNGYDNTVLKTNDNILVVAQGSPDLYVTSVEATNIPYNFTTVDKFNDDLVKNTVLQIGYYKVAFYETDGQPVTVAYQNVVVKSTDWVASTEFADFPYEAKITLSNFVDYKTVPQVVFDIADTMSGNYAPICKSGDKCVYIYGKVQNEITLKTVITFAPNVNGASVVGGGYNNRGKWQASTTYAIDDLVYTDNGQYVCIEGITSTTSPEQDTTHWQATFVATGKTKNGLKFSGQDNGTEVQKTFDGSTPVEVAFDENTMTAKEVNGVLKVGAKGTIPEALPQEASALKSGELPTTGWTDANGFFFDGGMTLTNTFQRITTLSLEDYNLIINNWNTTYINITQNETEHYTFGIYSRQEENDVYNLGFGQSAVYVRMKINKTTREVFVAKTNTSYTRVINKFYNTLKTLKTYTISDTFITANSDVLMELTDDGGVKANALADGSITVIRDTVPTAAIPYTYKVKQTNASGQFTVLNHFVPKVSESPTSLPVTYKKVSGELPTSGWSTTNPNLITSNIELHIKQEETQLFSLNKKIDSSYFNYTGNWQVKKYGTKTSTSTASYISTINGKKYRTIEFPNPDLTSEKYTLFIDESGNLYRGGGSSYWTTPELYALNAMYAYTISDTDITANTSVKMYLTDAGGVKAYSKAAGSIQVIRDSVPTTAIPYEYEVEQTSAEGLFEVINAYVPAVPTKTSDLQNDSGFITSSDIPTIPTKTSQLTNDSGFITAADIPSAGAWSDIVQSATITEQGTYYVLTDRDAIIQAAGNPSIVYWNGSGAAHGTKYVYSTVVDGVFTLYEFWAIINNSGTMTACYNSAKCENGVWTRVKSEEPVGFQYKKITN